MMKHIIFRDKKIAYQAGGSGLPVMLVHGFAEDHHIWKYQFKKLAKEFFVVAPDIPGSGKSESLEGNVSIEDYAEAMKQIADEEFQKEKKFIMIGHSMGGYIALAFAEKYPQALKGLGLFHSTAYADDDTKKEARKKGIEFIKNNGAELFIQTTTANLFSDKSKEKKPHLVEELIDEYKNFSADSLIQYYQAMMKRPNRVHVLENFAGPVLFIIGKKDKIIPLETALKQSRMPSVSHIYILKNSGHTGMREEKKRAIKILSGFLLSFGNFNR